MIEVIPFAARPALRLALTAIATTVLVSGCSDRHSVEPTQPPQSLSPSTASTAADTQSEPSPVQSAESVAPKPGDVVKGAFAPGGVATTYAARFDNGQLQRIEELRKSAGSEANGEYDFYGARLMQYRGVALQSGANIELKFDMQGSLTGSSGSDGKVSDEEISAIRTRAQVLRSHAVAKRATQGHGG